MVNILTIAFVHAILFIAAFRLMLRADIDADLAPERGPAQPSPSGAKPSDEKRLTPSERRLAKRRAQKEIGREQDHGS